MKHCYLASISLAMLLAAAVPSLSHAAALAITSSSIQLDTQGESVNAVEIHLTFDPTQFSIRGVNDGGSIINLWIAPPAFSNSAGTLDLSGIIPGGIATAQGIIVHFILVPKMDSGATNGFSVASVRVLLNDGAGTPAALTTVSDPFVLARAATSSATGTAAVDTTAPDPFLPKIARDPGLFNGRYFLVFAATDQNAGIDHYEVLEVPHGAGSGNVSAWQTATSPHLLADQTLSSDIYVKAVDKAGNFRTVELPAKNAGGAPSAALPAVLVAAGFAILFLGLVWAIRAAWKRKSF